MWAGGSLGGGGRRPDPLAKRPRAVVTPLRLALVVLAVAAVLVAAAAAGVASARAAADAAAQAAALSLDDVLAVDGAQQARAPGSSGPANVLALQRAPGQAFAAVDARYCEQLGAPQGSADRRFCDAYLKAPGNPQAKARASEEWRKGAAGSHRCSGLGTGCVKADGGAKRVGASACKPLAPRSVCGGDRTRKEVCMSGLCVLPGDDAPASPAGRRLESGRQQQQQQQRWQDPDAVKAKRGAAAPAAPVPGWGQLTVVVDPTVKGTSLPPTGTFLGTSHEWRRLTDWSANLPAFASIFRQYGRQPVIRLGGASQDAMPDAPNEDTWRSIAALARAVDAKVIVGLPLYQPGKAVDMSRRMIRDAFRFLPAGSLLLFELGNEPEFWPSGVGGYSPVRSTAFKPGVDAFLDYWTDAAKELNPCGADMATGRKLDSRAAAEAAKKTPVPTAWLSGPSWGNVNTIDPSVVRRMAERNRCSLREMNVHYYPYVDNTTITAPELLAEPLVAFGVEKFEVLQRQAQARGYRMRISETNSLFGGGRTGLSDTYAGALWAADLALAFANAGASGFHVHWGFGGAPVVGGAPNVGVQTNFFDDDPRRPYPSVHAPFYGALFFVGATGGPDVSPQDLAKTRFAAVYPLPPAAVAGGGAGCDGNLKTWALVDARGVLRVAAINKEERLSCNLQLRIGSTAWGRATVSRMLPGVDGLRSKGGITWAGQTYDGSTDGVIRGARDVQAVEPARLPADAIGMKFAPGLSYTVAMPALSGAVIEIAPLRR